MQQSMELEMILSAGPVLRKWVTTRNVLAVLLTLEAAIIGMVVAGERAARRADRARMAALGTQGLRLDHPAKPVQHPAIVEAADAEIRADALVIGVEIGGKARAYRLGALDHPNRHLVNDVISGMPVTVAYCNLSQSVQIYTNTTGSQPLDVEVVGRRDRQMVIKVAGYLYFHPSGLPVEPKKKPPPLPCGVLTPMVTTWKAWTNLHPKTDVYLGHG
jgi:hypothetical protein